MRTLSKPRLILMIIVAVIAIAALGWFVNKYLLRSRAAGANATLTLPEQPIAVDQHTEFEVPIIVNTDGASVVGIDIDFTFHSNGLELVDVRLADTLNGF